MKALLFFRNLIIAKQSVKAYMHQITKELKMISSLLERIIWGYGVSGSQTQGLAHARQAVYRLSYTPSSQT